VRQVVRAQMAWKHPGAAPKGVQGVGQPVYLLVVLAVAILTACSSAPASVPSLAVTPRQDTPAPPTSPPVSPALRTSPVPSPSPTQALPPGRPILYFGSEAVQGTRRFVTRGVYLDGQPWVPGLPASGAAWSPAGTRLAFIDAARPELLNVLVRTGASPPVYAAGEGERLVPWPAWAPDGVRTAVLIRRDGDEALPVSLAVIAVPPAQLLSRHDLPLETARLPGRTKPLNALRWSADGQRILVAWENAIVLDTRDGTIIPVTPSFAIAEWAGDGDSVLYLTIEGTSLGGFYRQPLDGSPPVQLATREQVASLGLRPMKDSYGLMHLSPDRKRLAMALGAGQPGVSQVRIYDAACDFCPDLASPVETYSTAGGIAALEWAPDGNALAAVAVLPEGGALQVLDPGTGLWRSPLPSPILQADELPVLGYIRVLSWGGG
jgi:hypothetical protein